MIIGSVAVSKNGRYKETPKRCMNVDDRISISALYLSSPVSARKCWAFHFNRMGGKVSGWNKTMMARTTAEMIRVIQSTHRQDRYGLCTMKPPITGPSSGPANAATANIGKVYTLSIGDQMSLIVPPAHTSGVAAKQPPMNLKASCAPILGDKAAAMTNIM